MNNPYINYYKSQAGSGLIGFEGVRYQHGNGYKNYYIEQAGSGLGSFHGVRYQRGHGWFGRLIKSAMPILRFVGKKALGVGANIADKLINEDKDLKSSAKESFIEEGKELANKTINKAR